MTLVTYTRRPLARAAAPARLRDLGNDEFEGYASLFDVPDGGGDVVAPGAFAASLRRRPAAEVRMLYQHFAHEPLGVWQQIREDSRGLYVRGRLVLDVVRAREVASLIADGALDGLSIGFRTVRARRERGLRVLTEIDLWEVSVVTFPLLKGSAVTAVGTKNHLPLVGRSTHGAKRLASGGGLPPPSNPTRLASLADLPTRGR